MLKDTTIVKKENFTFAGEACIYIARYDIKVISDLSGRSSVSVAKYTGTSEDTVNHPLQLDCTLYIQERGSVVLYTNYKTYERPVLGLQLHDYTPEQTVNAFMNIERGLFGYDLFSKFMHNWETI